MNEWLKKFMAKLKESWAKWTIIQKGVLVGIVAVAILAVVLMFRMSSKPTTVKLFTTPVSDENDRVRILNRLDKENVKADVDSNGVISVKDEATARRMRDILITEDLVPSSINPWSFFDQTNWSTTDYERKIQWQHATEELVKQHLEAIDDVTNASVRIPPVEETLFSADQAPVTVSVILRVVPGSDLLTNRRRIMGIQKLLLKAVEGLKEDGITITDVDGNQVNDFEGMAGMDRLSQIEKAQKIIQRLEASYRAKILKSLQDTLTADRVRDLNVKIGMDMSEKTSQSTEYTPIEITPSDPSKPYDTRVTRDSIPISSHTVTKEWQGTGFNPNGPGGTEGNNPPNYGDLSNLQGRSVETGTIVNSAINTRTTQENVMPNIDSISVAVNIDGKWSKKYDKNHNVIITDEGQMAREYTPVPEDELEKIASNIEAAIGSRDARTYRVSVTNVQFDRTAEHEAEDSAYFKARQTRTTVMLALLGTAVVLIAFIIFRFISREMERRRRLREEELLRKQQAAREQALWDAKEEGMEVTMSVEERKRAELQENAIAMAKEHPEDVAMLIRTWLMEES